MSIPVSDPSLDWKSSFNPDSLYVLKKGSSEELVGIHGFNCSCNKGFLRHCRAKTMYLGGVTSEYSK